MIADNLPFSSNQMHRFANDWHFKITTSSPKYPKSNGQAERIIQPSSVAVDESFLKNQASNNKSELTSKSCRDNLVYRQQQQKKYYDRKSKPLPSLNEGGVVRMNHNKTWKRGIVRFKHDAPRSYIVDTEDGSTLRRNRRDLIYTKENPPICAAPVDDSTDHFPSLEATQPQRLEFPIHPQCNSPTDDTTQSS
ncbi:hypothetical protein HELRODRAFT_176143 [Helobdella robusta]|uniref:Integrase catalytic domain-containing protein n=1 Tax=Helobdella robusta TaxID=6412 RepID=T1FA71_HELRO|nr:hypothetical protein HELRODRAFT_176143 [Helobdella robusta]ESO00279.1 hypothetical protein HELRODRAFT_176143 [Helobdella robusta]